MWAEHVTVLTGGAGWVLVARGGGGAFVWCVVGGAGGGGATVVVTNVVVVGGTVVVTTGADVVVVVVISTGEGAVALALPRVDDGDAMAVPVIMTANPATSTPVATLRLAIRAQDKSPRANATSAITKTAKPRKITKPDTQDTLSQHFNRPRADTSPMDRRMAGNALPHMGDLSLFCPGDKVVSSEAS
jgi:hypothetical protein